MPNLKTQLAYIRQEPTAQVAGQTVNDIPVAGAVGDVSGGATVDAEARAALNTLLAELRNAGYVQIP
jgi:hypothetical protein